METQASPAASSGAKPLLVRIKRKRLQPPVESLWLEVSDRPTKRLESQLSSFSLNEADSQTTGQEKPTRLLFRHVDTFTSLGANEAKRVDCLFKEIQNESSKEKRRHGLKCKDLLRNKITTSRQNYEAFTKKARFEQVWKRRREERKPDLMSENFDLYDLMRVDVDLDALERHRRLEEERRKEEQMLQNFLPLFKEHMPNVAEEVESSSSMSSSQKEEDEYVYDVYALEESPDNDSAQSHDYPLVHVVHNDYFWWGESDESDYDSEDSNAENNPMNDYPDEEEDTEEDEESDSGSEKERACSEESEEYNYDVFEDVNDFEKLDNDWSDISYGSSEERDYI